MGGITQRAWSPTKKRGPIAAEFTSPGPACVTLPPLIGQTVFDSKRGRAPAFSFGSRHSPSNERPGPGPGQYNVSGLSAKGRGKTLSLTLHGRTSSGVIEYTPAPGDYDPQKADKMVQKSSPKYSFGVKISTTGQRHSIPAPNVYIIPSALGGTAESNIKTAPAFSMTSRQKVSPPDAVFVPGPGTYEAVKIETVREKSAAYSIGDRLQLLDDQAKIPAPGAYSPEKVVLDHASAHTFGIKHSPYICNPKDIFQ